MEQQSLNDPTEATSTASTPGAPASPAATSTPDTTPANTPAASPTPTPAATSTTPTPDTTPANTPAASSTPTPAATFKTGEKYRISKAYIWLRPLQMLPIAAIYLFSLGTSLAGIANSEEAQAALPDLTMPIIGLSIVGIILAAAGVVLIHAWAWKHIWFVFDEEEFSFYSGIFVKRRMHLPYERVQSVNNEARLLQRIIGLCTVTVDSAGGSSNTGIVIPNVRLSIGQAISKELYSRKNNSLAANGEHVEGYSSENVVDQALQPIADWRGILDGELSSPANRNEAPHAPLGFARERQGEDACQPATLAAAAPTAPANKTFTLTNKQLLFAALTSSNTIVSTIIIVLTFAATYATVLLLAAGEQDIETATLLMGLGLPILVGSILFSLLITVVSSLLNFGGFSAVRHGERIVVHRGLITRTMAAIDVARVQSITIKQSPIQKLMGYATVYLGRITAHGQQHDAAKNGGEGKSGIVVHPFLKTTEVDNLLFEILPELDNAAAKQKLEGLAPVALRRVIIRRCVTFNWCLWLFLLVAGAIALWELPIYTVSQGALVGAEVDPAAFALTAIWITCLSLAVIEAAIGLISGILWAKNSGFAWSKKALVIHNDGIFSSTNIIPKQKLQAANTRSNPFQRAAKTATIVATTAAGVSHSRLRLIDAASEDADRYLKWVQ